MELTSYVNDNSPINNSAIGAPDNIDDITPSPQKSPIPITPTVEHPKERVHVNKTIQKNDLHDFTLDVVRDFRAYFLHSVELQLDQYRTLVYKDESYTLDQDIIRAYKSITVQDWFDQAPIFKTKSEQKKNMNPD
mmetsp:Transcript_41364/g.50313  ORF Transcript_41364/g.50313 Transcript_41364/m.50313 type:complete len:135 (+) Transcript_41364:814-1218(+)